jgi:hypothetical protein
MSDQAAKETAQAQRTHAYSKKVHGDSDYIIRVETDDHVNYYVFVQKDLGFSFGGILTYSGVWKSEQRAVDELQRILAIEAKHALGGVPMTREQLVSCYGVKTGRALHKVERIWRGEDKVGKAK